MCVWKNPFHLCSFCLGFYATKYTILVIPWQVFLVVESTWRHVSNINYHYNSLCDNNIIFIWHGIKLVTNSISNSTANDMYHRYSWTWYHMIPHRTPSFIFTKKWFFYIFLNTFCFKHIWTLPSIISFYRTGVTIYVNTLLYTCI